MPGQTGPNSTFNTDYGQLSSGKCDESWWDHQEGTWQEEGYWQVFQAIVHDRPPSGVVVSPPKTWILMSSLMGSVPVAPQVCNVPCVLDN